MEDNIQIIIKMSFVKIYLVKFALKPICTKYLNMIHVWLMKMDIIQSAKMAWDHIFQTESGGLVSAFHPDLNDHVMNMFTSLSICP